MSRKCNFHVACFDENEELCVPPTTDAKKRMKYLLARSVVIRHLERNLPAITNIIIRRFTSFTDADFAEYLHATGMYFIMCHDGAAAALSKNNEDIESRLKSMPGKALQASRNSSDTVSVLAENTESIQLASNPSTERSCELRFRTMISWFISNRYNVALINELQFMDTKVRFTAIDSRIQSLRRLIFNPDPKHFVSLST